MAPPMIDMTQQMTSPPPVIQPPQPPNIQVQPDPTRQPSLDPAAASPYTPLALPPADNGGGLAAALPKEEEPQNLGAVTKGGAVAYMLDKVLRGVVQGHQAAVQQQEDQFNKKIAAQQGLHNIAVKNYFGMLQSGQGVQRGPDGSPVVGADGQVVLNDDGKAALNQVKASIGSLQDSINQRFPPPKKSSRTVTNSSGSQSLIQRITNHKNDPNDALMATLQGAQVAYQQQAQQFLNPAYQAKVGQQAATTADTAASHANTAQLQSQLTGLQTKFAGMQPGPDRDALGTQIDSIKESMQALPKESSTTKLYISADGKDSGWYVPGHQPAGYRAKLPGSEGQPKDGAIYDPDLKRMVAAKFDASNKEIPGSRNPDKALPGYLTPEFTNRQSIAFQPLEGGGSVAVPVESSTQRQPFLPQSGVTPPAGASVSTPVAMPGIGKLTADQTKELEAAVTPRDQALTAYNLLRQSIKEAAEGKNVSLNDNDLVLAWNRAHTQRFNEAEINKINNLGGVKMKLEGNIAKIESGQLSPAQRALFARNLADELAVQQANVNRIRRQVGLPPEGTPAASPQTTVAPVSQPTAMPPDARAMLQAGHITTFKNGQQWTLDDAGQPKQVK